MPTILWVFLAIAVAAGIATKIAVGKARATAAHVPDKPARHIHEECAADGHKYQAFDTGYRCATCGNHVSSREGELYGRSEDGRHERRRGPR